ncbi:MAG: CoA-binding protein [Myxococcales bacterium]|nr:CoA-binding protein [Myxococcales bacterium]
MTHPLEDVIRNAEPFVFIGDSGEDRFPAMSYANASKKGHRVYYLDLGGMTASRGPVKGGKVYAEPKDIPADRSDLAVVWTKPHSAKRAVDIAHELGAKRIWFSFQTGHRDAVAHARSLDMEVVEIGRCPVYYMEGQVPVCKVHTAVVKLSGSYAKPPQLDPEAKRRELL